MCLFIHLICKFSQQNANKTAVVVWSNKPFKNFQLRMIISKQFYEKAMITKSIIRSQWLVSNIFLEMSWTRHNLTLVTYNCILYKYSMVGIRRWQIPICYHYCQNPTMVGFRLVGICWLAIIITIIIITSCTACTNCTDCTTSPDILLSSSCLWCFLLSGLFEEIKVTPFSFWFWNFPYEPKFTFSCHKLLNMNLAGKVIERLSMPKYNKRNVHVISFKASTNITTICSSSDAEKYLVWKRVTGFEQFQRSWEG